MKPQELTVSCCYSEGEVDILQILQSPFDVLLGKGLQNVEKYLQAVVS